VFEPCRADRRDGLFAKIVREINAENLRAKRAGERTDVECVGFHRKHGISQTVDLQRALDDWCPESNIGCKRLSEFLGLNRG
jgi:hypothetical protein